MPAITLGLLLLILCQLVGEIVRIGLGLPLPGPVIGMFLLAAILSVRGADQTASSDRAVTVVADTLIRHMGLLFVPAGVGIVSVLPLLRGFWVATIAALVGSTLLSLVTTGMVMHWWEAWRAAEGLEPPAS
ncbi:CidA/LrgA family protein [Sphingobium baderi]|uniref:Murein hydrolase transporter LrgA n=1 Tax=Sphingobium baderi TaxID=1332080 RepID=A0A0S3F654_9SPHN|nr:CidA/LrgA family protein [Sphingobium baderi]ALR23095.1 hypothetical protein ATN00_21660 [Sphingobium baderi]